MVKRDCGDWPGAIIVAAATERILLQWNQVRAADSVCSLLTHPGPQRRGFFCENRAGPTSAAPPCFAARITRATSACVIEAGRRLTVASLGLSWRNLR
jgi:hypothetical protein